METAKLSAEELAAAVRRRDISACEVVEAALGRAEAEGPAVGAFVTLSGDLAHQQAAELDRRIAAGEAGELPLLGVPCPIKDLNQVADVPLEYGSATMKGYVAEVDDGVTTWLREAGTTMIGKTNTPEFGFPCYTEPDNAPPARTPWDRRRMAGGSSGGAAAAVAAGIVPIAQGSDGGGSIRIPASCCGIVGLKPTRGRIGWGPHSFPGPGLTSNGVLTRTVRDTAIGLDVLSASTSGEFFQVGRPRTTFRAACDIPPGQLRVGVLTRPVIAETEVHPACLDAVSEIAGLLGDLGHLVEEAPVPRRIEQWDAFSALWSVGASSIPVPPETEHLLRPMTRWLREQGRKYTGDDYAAALVAAQQVAAQVIKAWVPFDIILTPTLAQPPAKLGELRDDADPAADFAAQCRFTPWTSVYNISGLPAISLPLHTAEINGVELPIGVMLGARYGAEATLLSLSAQLEDAAGFPSLDR
jgi:amidase